MYFCANCGAAIVVRVPDGDTLPRNLASHIARSVDDHPRTTHEFGRRMLEE